jgi:hypothetical protein
MKIKIKPSPKNTNLHTDKGMQLLEHSIETAGVLESISVATDGTIISGHARKKIFDDKEMKPLEIHLKENEYPVIVTNIAPDSKEYYQAQILANTTANKNFNLDFDLIDEIVEEFDIDIEEVGVEVVELENEPDYSLLDEDDEDLQRQTEKMTAGVKKAIQIEFEAEHYEDAYALVKFWREREAYVGGMIMEYLKSEKEKL